MFEWIRSARFESATARGVAAIPADAPMLADHFPGAPVLPGSLQIELCAQIAGPLAERALLAQHQVERWAFLGMIRNAAFQRPVPLPTELVINAEVRRVELSNVTVAVAAHVGTEMVARAELVMVMREADATWSDAITEARARVARWERS
jgi:3-hydroxyacyl-[acyl-carrier-protein] dehydratase